MLRRQNEMDEDIHRKIWSLSPSFRDKASCAELRHLTGALIEHYDAEGRLDEHPFAAARKRKLSLPFERIHNELKGGVCLVTGGLGCVGSALVAELLKFGVRRIVVVDKGHRNQVPTPSLGALVEYLPCDVLDFRAVATIFSTCRPDFVFHTAAQRDPGYAETHVAHTVQTNVVGTYNVVRACEQAGTVKQCVFSSTGKASRYFTEEVYAATKKVCEFILDEYGKESATKYSLVRFTHILDNSLMEAELRHASAQEYVAVHSPGKFVTAQNVEEAAYLMLNALVHSQAAQCQLLLVRHLEWPVESLQMALYHIKRSGRAIPIVFQGSPTGYTEEFFRGQLDWSSPSELNLLINVYENKQRRYNQAGDIVISRICSGDKATLEQLVGRLQTVRGENETKKCLLQGLELLVQQALRHVPKKETLNILKWGLQSPSATTGINPVSNYGKLVPLLLESLEGSEYFNQAEHLLCGSLFEA